jgi:hypothetical protein
MNAINKPSDDHTQYYTILYNIIQYYTILYAQNTNTLCCNFKQYTTQQQK